MQWVRAAWKKRVVRRIVACGICIVADRATGRGHDGNGGVSHMGRRPFAWLVLGLVFAFLVVSILLQAVNKPVTSAPAGGSAASPAQGTSVAGGGNTGTGGGTPAAGGGGSGGPGTTINATEKDFAIALDKSSVPAGTITFSIKNNGPSPHNLGVVPGNGASKSGGITGKPIKESENIDNGKSATLTVDLQPGTYQVVCSIPGHVQLGMIMQLTVT
jgi:plastocyanin